MSADARLARAVHAHVFLTQLPAATTTPRGALLHLALDALFADEGVDLVVGLRGARARAGRPDWRALLAQLAAEGRAHDAGDAEVFVCGPPALAAAVAAAAAPLGLPVHSEPY